MSILGSLIISLEAQTASFISGMSGASKTASSTAHEIEGAFSRLGDIASTALTPFGEIGSAVSETLQKMGVSAGAAIGSFGRLGGAAGITAGIMAGGAAAVLALDAGAIALAIHTAEAAAKLGETAQRAGISSQAFAGLSLAGKAVGVDSDSLAKALGLMNASAVKAALSADGTSTAFSRLGVQVRNTGGGMRDSGAIFIDVVNKIAGLSGPEQGYFARQIFGRGGLAILPLINEGIDKIKEKMDLAKEFGLGDPQAIASAKQFKETVSELQDALEGAALRLTGQLLPALQYVADRVTDAFKTGALQAFVDKIAEIVKQTFILGYEILHLGDLKPGGGAAAWASEFAGVFEFAGTKVKQAIANQVAPSLTPGDFAQRQTKQAEEIQNIWRETASKVNENLGGISWSQYKTDVENFTKGIQSSKPKDAFSWADDLLASLKKPKTVPDLDRKQGHRDRDFITEAVGKIRAEADEQAALATAISEVTANTIINTATAEANSKLAIASTRQKRAATDDEKKQAKELNILALAYKEGTKDNKGLEDFIDKTQTQTKSLQALGAAYSANLPIAIEQAREAEKTAPFERQAKDIQGTIDALRAMGVTGAALAPLEASLVQLESKMARAKVAVHNLFVAEDTEKWGKAIQDLAQQKAAMDAFIPVALQGASALREFNIQQQTEKFARENPALSQAQINEYRNSLRALEDDKVAMAAADRVAANQGFLATRQQIADLELLRQKQIAAGQDVTATDVLLYQTKTKAVTDYFEYVFQAQNAQLLGSAKIFDVQLQLIKQWDEAQFKVGSFSNRIKAVFNEISIQGRLAGSAIAQAFVTAFDGAETQLAHLIVTGKANFQNVLQSLEESVIKAGIQKTLGGLLGGIGLKIPGLTPSAQLGAVPTNPMYVFAVNAGIGGIGGGLPFEAGGAPTAIPGVVGAIGGESLGLPTGIFQQQLNSMAVAQTVFAGRVGASWTGILHMFRGAVGLMTSLFHIHTAQVIAGHAAQTGAAVTSQAAQTAATSAGAGARGNIGLIEHLKAIFRHAAGAAAAVFHKVFEALPFPLNFIVAPIAAAGAFAGVLAWGALGSAARGALVPEDMLMMTHKNEMVIPADISEGLQGVIRANKGGNVPAVQQFSPSSSTSNGRGDQFHVHVNQNVSAWDTKTGAEQLKRNKRVIHEEIRQAFKTGFLNPRRLARI